MHMESQQAGIAVKRLGDIMNAPAEPFSLVPQRGKADGGRIGIEGIGLRAIHAELKALTAGKSDALLQVVPAKP